MHKAQCTKYEAQSMKHEAQSTKHKTRSMKQNAQSINHKAQSTMHKARSTLHKARSTTHNARSIMQKTQCAGVGNSFCVGDALSGDTPFWMHCRHTVWANSSAKQILKNTSSSQRRQSHIHVISIGTCINRFDTRFDIRTTCKDMVF